MGGENKLLLEIDGVPVLARTLSAFQKCAAIRDIVLVCREQDIMPYTELAKAFSIDKLCTVTRGGETRTESVLAGITAAPENAVLVAVHDAPARLSPRPLLPRRLPPPPRAVLPRRSFRSRTASSASKTAISPPMSPATRLPRYRPRRYSARTCSAVRSPRRERGYSFTDDCAAVESLGTIVKATHGSYQNIKITTPEDILVAEALLTREVK